MATTLYPNRDARSSVQRTKGDADLGASGAWIEYKLSASRGAGVETITENTVTGPTSGIAIQLTTEYLTEPLDAAVTISGTITFNLRASENNMNANAAINCMVERVTALGAVASTVIKTTRTTELGTSEAAANFTGTPTSTNFLKGDRIRIRLFADDAGTMATGFTVSTYVGGTTGGASGDTFITFTENFAFQTSAPAGSVLYFTDTAGPAVGADVEKEAWTSRGAGAVTAVRNSVAGYTAALQFTDTAGGTAIEWYTKPLQAFTLSGLVTANLRGLTSNTLSDMCLALELAVVNGDGTGAVAWSQFSMADTGTADLTTTEAAYVLTLSGIDTSVTDGQRLRLRVQIDDHPFGMKVGHTGTFYYAGTSGGASGDSYVTLGQTVAESAPPPPRNPAFNLTTGGVY